jgi:hypothetical protein
MPSIDSTRTSIGSDSYNPNTWKGNISPVAKGSYLNQGQGIPFNATAAQSYVPMNFNQSQGGVVDTNFLSDSYQNMQDLMSPKDLNAMSNTFTTDLGGETGISNFMSGLGDTFSGDGVLGTKAMFGTEGSQGWLNGLGSIAAAGFGIYQGNQMIKLGKEDLALRQKGMTADYANQATTINNQLERQYLKDQMMMGESERANSPSLDEYMKDKAVTGMV